MKLGLTPRPHERLDDRTRGRMLGSMREFANILPIYSPENRAFCRAAFGMDFGEFAPQLMLTLFSHVQKYPHTLDYVVWIKQACEYILGERDVPPETGDYDTDQEWRDQHG